MDLEERVGALERRVSALEGPPPAHLPPAPPGTWWLLDSLAARLREADDAEPGGAGDEAGGRVAYGGIVRTPGSGQLVWQAEHPVPDLLSVDLARAAAVLAALAHPVRLEILRRLLLGAGTLAELQEIRGTRTPGQIHHHLRELRAAGLITAARNSFAAVPERVVPVLVAVAAALGPGTPRGTAHGNDPGLPDDHENTRTPEQE